MVTRAELERDGLAAFHLVNRAELSLRASPLYAGLQSIYEHMRDEGFVKAGVQSLENRMWAKLTARYASLPGNDDAEALKAGYTDYYQGKKDKVTAYAGSDPKSTLSKTAKPLLEGRKHPNIYSGLLTEILEIDEKAYGFGAVSYAWGSSAEAFLANLRARRPFKDYGASKDHGDNTHRIQWHIICRNLFEGVADAAKFYEATAYWQCDLVDHPDGRRTIYLWDFLCDNAGNTTGWTKDQAKGLNPLYVMDLLRAGDYPLLKSFVEYRRTKDMASDVKSGTAVADGGKREEYKSAGVMLKVLDRAALRLEKKPFSSLSKKAQDRLARSLGAAGFTDN